MLKKGFEEKLELENEGQLSIFFAGTGSAFSKSNFQTNLIVVKGKDHVLVDCGTTFTYALENQYKTQVSSIKTVFITHPHADHIGSLEEIALIGRYVSKTKPSLIITDAFKKKLWKESLKGGLYYSEEGKLGFDDYFNQIKPVLIYKKPYEVYEVNVGSINLKIIRTRHITTKPDSLKDSQISYGLIIDNRIFFTGDTQFNPEQLQWICSNFKLDQIFADCDVSGYAEGVHESYKQLMTLDSELKKNMYLCHYNGMAAKKDAVADGFAGFAEAGKYYIY